MLELVELVELVVELVELAVDDVELVELIVDVELAVLDVLDDDDVELIVDVVLAVLDVELVVLAVLEVELDELVVEDVLVLELVELEVVVVLVLELVDVDEVVVEVVVEDVVEVVKKASSASIVVCATLSVKKPISWPDAILDRKTGNISVVALSHRTVGAGVITMVVFVNEIIWASWYKVGSSTSNMIIYPLFSKSLYRVSSTCNVATPMAASDVNSVSSCQIGIPHTPGKCLNNFRLR